MADLLISQSPEARIICCCRIRTLNHRMCASSLRRGSARITAQRATPTTVVKLPTPLQDQRSSVADVERLLERDMAFHCELATISGNPIYPATVEATLKSGQRVYPPIVRAPGAEQLTLAEHRRTIDAIAAKEPDVAAKARQGKRLAMHPASRIEELLPHRWRPST